MVRLLTSTFIFTLVCLANNVWAGVTANIDRGVIANNETLQLTVSVNETSFFGEPDISEIENYFNILNSGKSSSTTIVNGKRESKTEWTYILSPKSIGKFSFSGIEVDGEKSQPFSIVVKKAANISGSSNDPIFVETTINKREAYVQEEVLITYHINAAVGLQEINMDDFSADKALVKEISNTQYRRIINGIEYRTFEVIKAIFPQESGDIIIPSLTISGSMITNQGRQRGFGSFFNQGKPFQLMTEELSLTVKSIPPSHTGPWLPAKNLTLAESWSADPEKLKVGDSITRTITLNAQGLSIEQLPPLNHDNEQGYKVYPEQPKTGEKGSADGFTSQLSQNFAIVVTQPGEITLPEISIRWWNLDKDTYETATLPEMTLRVIGDSPIKNEKAAEKPRALQEDFSALKENPVEISNSNPVNTGSSTELLIWKIVSLLNGILALVFLFLFLRKKPIAVEHEETRHQLPEFNIQNLKKACDAQDLKTVKSEFLKWINLQGYNRKFFALSDARKLIDETKAEETLIQLEKALYNGNSGTIDFGPLVVLIEETSKKQQENIIKPLYPG